MSASHVASAPHGADERAVKTFCRLCAALCGLEVHTDGRTVSRVLPDRTHPYNWRDFCAKGGSAHVLRDHPKRLRTPMKRVGDGYVAATYEEAVADIAQRLARIRDRHGPNAIATYLGNPGAHNTPGTMGQQGFMKAIGSENAFYVGSIDQNNFHLVAQEMYGCELAVLIPDVDEAQCFLFIGMNPAVSMMGWLDTVPEGWNRVLAAQAKGADLIVVDPRQTPTTRKATTHVAIRPGEDWAFLLGILKVVFENGWTHAQDCAEADGVDVVKGIAMQASLDELARRCGVPAQQIADIARRFATVERSVCVARTGVAHNRNGTLGEWLSHVLNLVCGRIDRRGGRYYQPGILRNSMKFINAMTPPVKRRSRIGGYRAISGAYPLAVLPDEILTPGQDQVRALIINSGNPVISGPDGARLDAALKELDLLVAVDFFQRESHRHAHWLIPGSHFLEREDFYALIGVIMEKPFAQLGQAVLDPPPGVRTEFDFFADLAIAMKRPFMGLRGLNTTIRLSRWVARVTKNPKRAFNPRWIWAPIVMALSPLRWRDVVNQPQGLFYEDRRFGHFRPSLQTPNGRIQAAPADFVAVLCQRLTEPVPEAGGEFPFRLVNQRRASMMNSWLVETVKRTKNHGDYIDINPTDASALQIADEGAVRVTSATASVDAKARVTDDVPPGVVSMDHGWGSRLFDPQGGSAPEVQGVRRNLLVSAKVIDELAGTPNLNGTQVRVTSLTEC